MQKELFLVKSNKRWVDYLLATYHYENFDKIEMYYEKEKELYEIDIRILKYYISRIEAIKEANDISKIQPLIIMYVTVLFSIFTASVSLSKEMWGFIVLVVLVSILIPYIFNVLIFAKNRWTKVVYLKSRFEQILIERQSE
ncbi:hypothetical protein [Bacillus cereus]|uniref:hypothetical protein n=1 Tax=Bacillus cereus TaxID=1396 RepID=UPI002119ABCB|nr:hypothetical protein [Bacillus cereus]